MSDKIIPIIQHRDRAVTSSAYKKFGEHLLITGAWRTIQGEGPFAGHPSVFVRTAGCNFGKKDHFCQFCFPTSTPINTLSGKKTVGEVEVGDYLYTLDEEGNIVPTRVNKVMTRDVSQKELLVVKYQMPGEEKVRVLTCTREHPFHTTKRGYVPAENLKVGEKIFHVAGNKMRSATKKYNNPMKDKNISQKNAYTRAERFAAGEYDFTRSSETKHRLSLSKRGEKNPMKRHEVRLKSALGHEYPKSQLEVRFESAFKAVGLKIKYSGNTGKLIVGDDEVGYRMPDFFIPGTNKLIETYDITFKYYCNVDKTKRKKRTVRNYENPTRKFYEKLGYEVLFLTNKDLPHPGKGNGHLADFSYLKEKVGMFKRNGAKIVSVEPISNVHYGLLRKDSNEVTVVNFSCGPHNTFLIGGLHVHNCDTSFEFANGKMYSPEKLLDMLIHLEGYNSQDVLVITGGEPTLQRTLIDFMEIAQPYFKAIQIETNGTQASFFDALLNSEIKGLQVVVSPKASMAAGTYAVPNDRVLGAARAFKFVVSADPDSPHHTVPAWAFELQKRYHYQLYVSPMAIYARSYDGEVSSIWQDGLFDKEATAANYAYAAKYAMEHNCLLSLQTHLFLGVA